MGFNHIFKTGLLITAVQFLLSSSCNKDDTTKPCVRVSPYSFAVTSEFTPQRAICNVGDTIFLISTFPKTLTNLINNQLVDYSNSVAIGGTISFIYMDSVQKVVTDSYSKFKTIPLEGATLPITNVPEKGVNSHYAENVEYRFKIGIIPLQKGIYLIGVNNLTSAGLRGKDCTDAGFSMTVSNTDKHFDLFQYALGYAADGLLMKNAYCFRVQ
jgi:hypothetical protein